MVINCIEGGLTGGDSPAAPKQPSAFDVTPETDASSLEGGAERGCPVSHLLCPS